ncbi:GNAT family N-acetyltransferase [Candidatus Tisiphia endosymbiont of Myopa tessellatipennis]|uniref:GNAT family N-acetyltransferase n=1 Tax=Candidatus Tisiphia endosymbiont of Myopa tessellatipennis TaxID=3066257 RepID=UPI00313D69C5
MRSTSIDSDPNQYLMIVEMNKEIVGTCHLTIMPSLTFIGSTRMQIEAVRISEKYRGQHFGEWMMSIAMKYGKSQKVSRLFSLQLIKNVQEPNSSMKDLVLKQHMKE